MDKIDVNNRKFREQVLPEYTQELHALRYNAEDQMNGAILSTAKEDYDYYYGRLPVVQLDGASTYTDRTVESTVNAALTDLTTCFTTGDAVRFVAESNNQDEALKAQIATDTVNQIFLRANSGSLVLENAIKEALVCGTSWIKTTWHTTTKRLTDKIVSPKSEDEIAAHLQGLRLAGVQLDDKKTDISDERDEDGNLTVSITYTVTAKQVKVEFVPVEQMLIEENASDIENLNYIGQRTYKTRQELIDLGYPKERLEELFANYAEDMQVSLVRDSRTPNYPLNISNTIDTEMNTENLAQRVMVYEEFLKTSRLDNDGTIHMYHSFSVGNDEPFFIEEVDTHPYNDITPLPMGGTIWGESITSLTKDIQNLRSQLKRYMLDAAASQAYPSYIVSDSLTPNSQRAIAQVNIRPGTIVPAANVANTVAFFPMKQMPQGLDFLLTNSENEIATRTGVNPTQQGINSDMVHSAGLETANLLLSAAQGRMRMMARTLANTHIKRVMRNIYEIFRNNAEVPLSVETAHGIVKVNPKELVPRDHIKVATALSNTEKAETVQRIMLMIQGLNNISQMENPFVTPEQKHYMTQQYCEALGFKDYRNYITEPQNLPQQQPNPAEIAQMQQAQAQTELLVSQTKAAENKAQADLEKSINDAQIATEKLKFENARLIFEQESKATEHDIAYQDLELRRQEIALKAQHNDDITAIKKYMADTKYIHDMALAHSKPNQAQAD